VKRPVPCIALLTDFGTRDPYVGIMKGTILSLHPEARIVDVTHEVPIQCIESAGLHLRSAVPFFPTGTLFVVVVDPGVGTKRRILYGESARHRFLAPDNGVLSLLEPKDRVRTIRSVKNRAFMRSRISNTFHGRDIFAPVAAWLSLDTDPAELGPVVRSMEKSEWKLPRPRPDGSVSGKILSVDRFGNLITDIPASAIRNPARSVVMYLDERIDGISKTYGDRKTGDLMALIGSTGTLEIAKAGGRAAAHLMSIDGTVTVYPPGSVPRDSESDTASLIETNLDNVSGEQIGGLFSHLFSCGALDVWTTPIQMKKSRPGLKLSVLAPNPERERLAREVLRHAPTFGVRSTFVWRDKLSRRMEKVRTKFGVIRVKIGSLDGEAIRAAPEYEDVASAARRAKVPFDVVHLAASEAGRRLIK
jgi:S-adenosylmethionine hydrolase